MMEADPRRAFPSLSSSSTSVSRRVENRLLGTRLLPSCLVWVMPSTGHLRAHDVPGNDREVSDKEGMSQQAAEGVKGGSWSRSPRPPETAGTGYVEELSVPENVCV